ncbi:MAG: phasin family protein [Candidatus Contendobacter sp.]|nr:phasin family protein [Candidatus Contendobacter sp.]
MTTHVANSQFTSTLSRSADLARQAGLVGLGACVAAQREVQWLFQTLLEQGQRLEAALLDNLTQRAVIAGNWVDAFDRTTMTWRNQVEQSSRFQFERFLHRCGLVTHDDLRALARKLDDLNLRVADLDEDSEKAA